MPFIDQEKVDEKTRQKLEAIIEKSYATFCDANDFLISSSPH